MMRDKIFKSVFFTSMAVLLVGFLLVISVLWNYFDSRIFAELESEAEYISYMIEDGTNDIFSKLGDDNKRITVISPDGTVLEDTAADAKSLENHSARAEIKEAYEKGFGKSARYSKTLTEKTLYYARKLNNGNILRVSVTQNSIIVILLGLMRSIIWVIIIALAMSFFLSRKVSEAITKPINEIDLENPTKGDTYEELEPLLKKLSAQKRTISRQIKEAEQSREEFRLICENMNEGFLVIDKNKKVLSYNTAAVNLLETENIENSSVLALNRTKNFRNVVEEALCGKHAENIIRNEDKTYSLIANPVYRSEKLIGAVIVIIDITESAKREQMRSEFTSNVSHELKTPLTSISGFAEMMKEGGMSEETVKDFASSVYDEAQRLIGLVGDIMKISYFDEGAGNEEKENVDLYELSKEIAERIKPVAKKDNISINVSGETTYVFGNRKILEEMIYNLCDNGVKYNKCGGTVDIIIEKNGDCAFLTVKDTGEGIPQKDRARVFERFYRVDKSRSKKAGGTGLGLAIVKHGAAYHNAKISLESTEGVGSTISLAFDKNED